MESVFQFSYANIYELLYKNYAAQGTVALL